MESRFKFTVLDFEVRKALNLSGNDWIVFSFIYNLSKSGVNYNGSLNEMSKLLGLSYPTMFRVIHRLKEQGYISVVKVSKYINLGYMYYITKKVFDIAKNIEEQKSKNEKKYYQNEKKFYQNEKKFYQNDYTIYNNINNNNIKKEKEKEKKYFDMDEIDNYQVID